MIGKNVNIGNFLENFAKQFLLKFSQRNFQTMANLCLINVCTIPFLFFVFYVLFIFALLKRKAKTVFFKRVDLSKLFL